MTRRNRFNPTPLQRIHQGRAARGDPTADEAQIPDQYPIPRQLWVDIARGIDSSQVVNYGGAPSIPVREYRPELMPLSPSTQGSPEERAVQIVRDFRAAYPGLMLAGQEWERFVRGYDHDPDAREIADGHLRAAVERAMAPMFTIDSLSAAVDDPSILERVRSVASEDGQVRINRIGFGSRILAAPTPVDPPNIDFTMGVTPGGTEYVRFTIEGQEYIFPSDQVRNAAGNICTDTMRRLHMQRRTQQIISHGTVFVGERGGDMHRLGEGRIEINPIQRSIEDQIGEHLAAGMAQHIDEQIMRSYHMGGAVTGRMSSHAPSFQELNTGEAGSRREARAMSLRLLYLLTQYLPQQGAGGEVRVQWNAWANLHAYGFSASEYQTMPTEVIAWFRTHMAPFDARWQTIVAAYDQQMRIRERQEREATLAANMVVQMQNAEAAMRQLGASMTDGIGDSIRTFSDILLGMETVRMPYRIEESPDVTLRVEIVKGRTVKDHPDKGMRVPLPRMERTLCGVKIEHIRRKNGSIARHVTGDSLKIIKPPQSRLSFRKKAKP